MYDVEFVINQLGSRTNARFDCPACDGENCLSVSRVGGKIKYHCFRNSCNLKPGTISSTPSADVIRASLGRATDKVKPFSIPDYWTKGISSEKCLKWILKTHCMKPYTEGKFNVAYDPKQNRVCYLVRGDDNSIVGAVGRALGKAVKTYNYPGSAKVPFVCNNGSTLVLVEDCASAASVTRLPGVSGLALLGTNLKDEYFAKIHEYAEIIVALDLDAIKTAVKIKNSLTYHHPNVKLWRLHKDIKDMDDKELEHSYVTK